MTRTFPLAVCADERCLRAVLSLTHETKSLYRAALRKSLTEILRSEYRLGDEEIRRCLLAAVEGDGGLEFEKDWGARNPAPERSS